MALDNLHLEKVTKTLIFLAKTFEENNIRWGLGASGALMVHGVNVIPYDLDIFVSKDDVYKIADLLGKFIKNPIHDFTDKTGTFIECQLLINGVEVEICELDKNGTGKSSFVNFRGVNVPVNSLENELLCYENRPGKEDVVKLIEKKLLCC